MVVERYRHADIAQRGRIALQVLDGIGVGVQHVGILQHLARRFAGALSEEVVVGIDAGEHRASYPR